MFTLFRLGCIGEGLVQLQVRLQKVVSKLLQVVLLKFGLVAGNIQTHRFNPFAVFGEVYISIGLFGLGLSKPHRLFVDQTLHNLLDSVLKQSGVLPIGIREAAAIRDGSTDGLVTNLVLALVGWVLDLALH